MSDAVSPLLEKISIHLPGTHPEFHDRLLEMLAPFGNSGTRNIDFSASEAGFFPHLSIAFPGRCVDASAHFDLTGAGLSVPIENSTGVEKRNSHSYRPLPIDEASRRIATNNWNIVCVDHIGFNLPWFGPGLHPRILELRARLAAACLYHLYPSGEPWDFILPATPGEITGLAPVDYSLLRRPKFELVSFGGCSTPLLQIDVGADARFEDVRRSFPEALAVPSLRQNWLYLENPYRLDVCLVLSEFAEGDWSDFFAGYRLAQDDLRGREIS